MSLFNFYISDTNLIFLIADYCDQKTLLHANDILSSLKQNKHI